MSLDRELRESLLESASDVQDRDVDTALSFVRVGARRRRRIRRAMAVTGALAVAVAAILVGPRALDALRGLGRSQPAEQPTLTELVAGTYMVTLPRSDPEAEATSMTGTWTVRLSPEGTLEVAPPPGFIEAVGAAPSGNVYTLSRNAFRTNVFDACADAVGSYRWELSGDRLTFSVRDDACAERLVLFGAVWVRG